MQSTRKGVDLDPSTEVEIRLTKTVTLEKAKKMMLDAQKKGWYARIFKSGKHLDR